MTGAPIIVFLMEFAGRPREWLRRTKGNGSRVACLAMVFKLCESAQKTWRLLNGATQLPDVIAGVKFVNGEKTEKIAA